MEKDIWKKGFLSEKSIQAILDDFFAASDDIADEIEKDKELEAFFTKEKNYSLKNGRIRTAVGFSH